MAAAQLTLAQFRAASYNPETMGDDEDILKLAGEALYGRQWQTPLSRDLGVTDRTVRNWTAGGGRPSNLISRLLELLRAREGQLNHVIALAERLQNR